MTNWQFTFPSSRTCLWDNTPLGKASNFTLAKNGWLVVQFSPSALQLALHHKSNSSKTLDCFLIATSWIDEAEKIILEVNRFDPGSFSKNKSEINPTSLIPGDIAARTQVVIGAHPDSKYLTHNLKNLQETLHKQNHLLSLHPTSTFDLSHLLSLRVHCSHSHTGTITIRCGCVMPSFIYQATPIRPIPIIPTALAKNLSGPLSISEVQGRIKHGYITMESARKLVLLLHSDPKVASLPLVGVWVSGVITVHHPLVWAACVTYIHSAGLTDRVWGEGDTFVVLVYCKGQTQPSFWECRLSDNLLGRKEDTPPFEISTGEVDIQFQKISSDPIRVDLYPARESTALHTLMETALSLTPSKQEHHPPPLTLPTASASAPPTTKLDVSLDSPQPSPLPTPTQVPQRVARDRNLSVISSFSILDRSSSAGGGSNEENFSVSAVTMDGVACHPRPPPRPSSSPHHEQEGTREGYSPYPSSSNGTSGNFSHRVLSSHLSSSSPHHEQDGKKERSLAATNHGIKSSPIVSSSQQTTPTTSNAPLVSPNTVLQQHQFQAIMEQINNFYQTLGSGAPVTASPVTPTAEATTNTGVSLYEPHPSTTPTGPSLQCSSDEEEDPCVETDLSVRTAAISQFSHNSSNMLLDLQSFGQSSSFAHSQSFGESVSVSASDNFPNLPFQDQDQQLPTEDLLAKVMEVVHQLQPSKQSSPIQQSPSKEDSSKYPIPTHSASNSVNGYQSCTKAVSGKSSLNASRHVLSRSAKDVSSHSCLGDDRLSDKTPTPPRDRHSNSPYNSGGSTPTGNTPYKVTTPTLSAGHASIPTHDLRESTSAGHTFIPAHDTSAGHTHAASIPTHDVRGLTSAGPPSHTKTLSSSHPTNPIGHTPYETALPSHEKWESNPHGHSPYSPLPFSVPYSTRDGHVCCHLHPEVLHRQYCPDISMLPVPRIMCPVNGESVLFNGTMGSEYSMDEDLHLADTIDQKYLGLGVHANRNHTSDEGDQWRVPEDHNGHSVNQTLANVSMATYKYLQRHNLLPTKQAGAAATMPSVQEENEPGPNHILDKNFYILKTRPRLP